MKPARYTGGEWNEVKKDHASVDVRFALAFPDVYEVGMSNLGLRILYHILNKRQDVACERVFAPASDMEEEMRRAGIPLFTLESFSPLRDFEIVGFSLSYEMTYTNVLNMLDLAGIPVLSSERGDDDPLIIAGGHCTFNPEPMVDFIDAFVIGEGEDVVGEIVDVVKAHRGDRRRALDALAGIDGVYVPSRWENGVESRESRVESGGEGVTSDQLPVTSGGTAVIGDQLSVVSKGNEPSISPSSATSASSAVRAVGSGITKRVVADFENADYPDRLIVPFIETVHERVALEIMRGCTRGCRFCQAGTVTRPVREKSKKKLMEQAEALVRSTGYEEISLISLSSADYTGIDDLVHSLIDRYEAEGIGVSLPSLRADTECVQFAADIERVRKSGLTFAPEAGTQRLRNVINKNVTEDDLLGAVGAALDNGWRKVKLYFMIGLPTETDDDVAGIGRTVDAVLKLAKQKGKQLTVNVGVSSFVPKPHTPFQWRAQDSLEELDRKVGILHETVKGRNVSLSWGDPDCSRIEAVMSRGDRRVGKAIYEAWKSGAKFDGWNDHFSYDRWVKAFEKAGIDPDFYACRVRSEDEPLPWDHIDTGVDKRWLWVQDRLAEKGITVEDCKSGGCLNCGINKNLPDSVNGSFCPEVP